MQRESARNYLISSANEKYSKYPQMCCYAFDSVGIDINVYGRHDLSVIDALLGAVDLKGKTVVDIGANVGNHSAAFAKVSDKVFAFEPHPKTFKLLEFNLSEYSNVTLVNLGISDQNAIYKAVSHQYNFGAASITDRSPIKFETVWEFKCAILDDFEEIKNVALIKIDVEGHEFQALKGSRKLIQRERPVIVIEQCADVVFNGSSTSIDFLRSLGYDYMYQIEELIKWRIPQNLPNPFRKCLRFIESILFGPPEYFADIKKLKVLDKKDYPTLILSTTPLITTPH